MTVCLAGFGNFGKKLYGYLETMPEFFSVKYLYHPDGQKAAAYGPKGIADLDQALNDEEVEAFIITAPNDQHYELLNRILSVGRHHIFVEKPMTAYYSEAVALWQLVKTTGKALMVGHSQRREPAFRMAMGFVGTGEIGQLVSADLNFSHGVAFSLGSDEWRYSLKRHREGSLAALGSHSIDTIHYLFGPVQSVYASIRNLAGKTEAPDSASAMMRMENGMTVFLRNNYNTPSEKRCTIWGTDGVIHIDRDKFFLRLGRDVNRIPSVAREIPVHVNDPFIAELTEFFRVVRKGVRPETGYKEGLAVMTVIEACWLSSRYYLPIMVEYEP